MNTSSSYEQKPTVIEPKIKNMHHMPLPSPTNVSRFSRDSPGTSTIDSFRWFSSKRHHVSPPKSIRKYVDHSQDPLAVKKPKEFGEVAQRGAARQFPTKLYEMLIKASSDESEGGGFEDCVSWQPHGRCFIVRNPKMFVANIMPK